MTAKLIEDTLKEYGAKPNLAKVFCYEKEDFQVFYKDDLAKLRELIQKLDPEGKFSNEYSRTLIDE